MPLFKSIGNLAGLLERLYEEALIYELGNKGLKFEQQKSLKTPYKNITLSSIFVWI